ncbi:protein asteroid homolog 1-like [Ruditapes philippinarum]|uniref:protein asteroid homolog 1-like n=1 Tax=Ruditapes philippinarum TaxID=129788 RepID=UPI00295A747B|nr:protein asteroid homolog 1-like [Ruditapes philippinarum]
MGVRGLQTYIRKNRNKEKFLSDYTLRDTKLIIDGSNLVYFLYQFFEIPFKFGGDYDHFARECGDFFSSLKRLRVEPIVIFDGADDPTNIKFKTHLDRLEKQSRKVEMIFQQTRRTLDIGDTFILPVLAELTFRNVLVKLGIVHACCLFEADSEIAFLANKFRCPVLSADSDFCVFALEVGCVHPADLLPLPEHLLDYLPTKIYNCRVLMEEMNMVDDDVILPVFATLVGNDYFDSSNIKFKSPTKNSSCELSGGVHYTLDWLKKAGFRSGTEAFKKLTEQLSDETQKSLFVKSVKSYFNIYCTPDQHDAVDLSEEVLETVLSRCSIKVDLPKWFILGLIRCDINSKFLLNIAINKRYLFKSQIEDHRNPPSFACSKGIRRVIYEILVGQNPKKEQRKIKEYHRVKTNVSNVNPLKKLPHFPKLPHITDIGILNKHSRKTLLFAIFGDMVEILPEEMDETSSIIILMLSLWQRNSKASVDQLKAFVISIFTMQICTADDPNEIEILSVREATVIGTFEKFSTNMKIHFIERMDLNENIVNVLHKNAQFQSIYKEMQVLNQLLLKPVYLPNPERFLQSTLVCKVFLFLTRDNGKPEEVFCKKTSRLFVLFEYWLELIEQLCERCERHICPVASTVASATVTRNVNAHKEKIKVSINNAA